MATVAPDRRTAALEPTETHDAPGVLGHSVRRESLAFVRPAPGRYVAIEEGELMRLVLAAPTAPLSTGAVSPRPRCETAT